MLTLYRPRASMTRPSRLLADWMHAPLWDRASEMLQARIPNVTFDENEEAYFLDAELPGMSDQDVDVRVDDGTVHIRAERNVADEGDDGNVRRRAYSSFRHSFRLPGRVDSEAIEGKMKDGVLRLTLPKRKADRISIQAERSAGEEAGE